jgi:hypothetical protein
MSIIGPFNGFAQFNKKRLVLSVAKASEKLAGTLATTCGVDETICLETR